MLHIYSSGKCEFYFRKGYLDILGRPRMRTPVREAFSYGIRHGIRHIHCDSMKYDFYMGVRILPNIHSQLA